MPQQKKRREKHLCKSNGVRWMNSDRLNALIECNIRLQAFYHMFSCLPFFLSLIHSHKMPKCINNHSFRVFHRTGKDRRMCRIERFHCIFPFTCRFMILSMLPFRFTSTQKYFTIDFLWHMQQKKCPDEISQSTTSSCCNKIL
jgi:hypothetical protein